MGKLSASNLYGVGDSTGFSAADTLTNLLAVQGGQIYKIERPPRFVTITIDSSYINTNDTTIFLRAPEAMVLDSMHTVGLSDQGMSVAIDVRYTAGLSTAGTAINSTPPTITNCDVGDTDTSFDNGTVALNNIVWIRFTTVTTKPKSVTVTLYYH